MDDLEHIRVIGERMATQAALRTGSSDLDPGACIDCGAPIDGYEWGRCPDCEAAVLHAELATLRYRDRLDAYGGWDELGSRLERVSFATFSEAEHNHEARAVADTWLSADPMPNLIITGPIACGKSYLAACVHRALHDREIFALWLNALSIKGIGDSPERLRQIAGSVPVLVLDDLGKVHPGKQVSWVEECYYAVVDARYREERPTVVTTEWRSDALAERVGSSVVTRLEHGAIVAGIRRPATPYRRPQS